MSDNPKNEDQDLKSSSSIEANETFEEKMARIQAILNGQKNEIEGRKDGKDDVVEAPSLEHEKKAAGLENLSDSSADVGENRDRTSDNSNDANDASDSKEELSESTSVIEQSESAADSESDDASREDAEQTSSSVPEEVSSDTLTSDAGDIPPVPPVLENESPLKNHEKSEVKEKNKLPLILTILVLILIVFASILYFQKKEGGKGSKPSESSLSSKSDSKSSSTKSSSSSSPSKQSSISSEASSSSSSAQSSSSTPAQSSSSTPTRAEIIASVQPGRVILDPNITGNEPEFNWPAGLQTEVIAQAQAAGWGDDGYKFIPAQISGGQGWVNLYDASGKFILSVDLATRYILQ
ncbi:MAG: MSCRAMM family adhesin SdrC [Streptococcaceae bacterium]|jgi:hypothetical protein|nr:MSCRAMM family adhesin SdrC [Streptococcaceae bacterium]